MAFVRVTVERRTKSALIRAAVRAGLAEGVRETAVAIRDRARELVAVDTGNLQGTIECHEEGQAEWEVSAGGPTPESPEGANYVLHQEYGTRFQPGTPFMTPATLEAEEQMPRTVAKAVKEHMRGT